VIVINGTRGTLARGRAKLRLLLLLMLLLMLKRVGEVQVNVTPEIVGRRGGIRWRLMHCND
jgi:asparagine synthetase A